MIGVVFLLPHSTSGALKLYWRENGQDEIPQKIRRANLDGTNVEDVIVLGEVAFGGFAVESSGVSRLDRSHAAPC